MTSATEPGSPRPGPLLEALELDDAGLALPVVSQREAERCDAARNRKRILSAAIELVDQHGADAVTMDDVAARAGVGKGTLFRRFGNRAGLMLALLDHTEHEFQHSYMFGPPPLGPGAPPAERLTAFAEAMVSRLIAHGGVIRSADRSLAGRFAPARAVSVAHITALLREAGTPGDVELHAEMLMTSLDASFVLHQLGDKQISRARFVAAWSDLAHRVLAGR